MGTRPYDGNYVADPETLKQSKSENAFVPDDIYKVTPENWYKTFPYAFRHTNRDGAQTTFFLPINPSDISVTTHFATNIVSTLYGVVEEHSEVRFYDFQISGTTGFVPRHVNAKNLGSGLADAKGNKTETWKTTGRAAFQGAGVQLGGFLPQLTNTVLQATDNIQDLLDKEKNETGVYIDQTGYLAFHNFYRFLLNYKKDTSGELGFKKRKFHPLTWINYKDGQKYDCIVTGFSMNKSSQNPYMYNYSMSMRCFNMRSVDAEDEEIQDLGLFGLGLGDIGNIPGVGALGDLVKSATGAINAVAGFF